MSVFAMEEYEIIAALRKMEADPSLVTESSFRANKEVWPDNRIPFVDAHMAYLKARPNTNPEHYLSNLRLMLRRNPSR